MFEQEFEQVVSKDNFTILNLPIEKTAYLDGKEKYGFHFLSWLCVFIKNKPVSKIESNVIQKPAPLIQLENKKKSLQKKIRLQQFFNREFFSLKGFLFTKFKEPVVKNVPYEGEMVNLYIESRMIAIAGYALVLRPKHLIYKALDLYALPATRKNNPNKTDIDFV